MFVTVLLGLAACNKDETSERFVLLTSHAWISDSLLADGIDASGPGEILEKFKGEVIFNVDGTGSFGEYTGTWMFVDNETNLVIQSPELLAAITTHIVELTETSLKVTFSYPTLEGTKEIRMTFKPE